MSAKSILEADGKAILNYHLTRAPVIKPSPLPKATTHNAPSRLASLYFPADADVAAILDQAEITYPWLLQSGAKFVAKPDQLIKRRGKSGLLALNKTWAEAKKWVAERAGKAQRVETVDGVLRQFLVEPFVPHPEGTEYYININSVREVCIQVSASLFCLCIVLQLEGPGEMPRVSTAETVHTRVDPTSFWLVVSTSSLSKQRFYMGDTPVLLHLPKFRPSGLPRCPPGRTED
jgi:hypothetical protein